MRVNKFFFMNISDSDKNVFVIIMLTVILFKSKLISRRKKISYFNAGGEI